MGLAQAKTRRKIGKDPNNTKWTRDTDSFGQKILRSQGWEPGQYLGAKDAAHAVHHTAANASFIRVALKDDMLGLGFKQARDDRVTGMDVFSDLLGRLNGKSSESIDKERQARATLKGTLYCDTRFGPMRFVSGGWLVGDQVKDDPIAEPKEEDKDDIKMEDVPAAAAVEVSSKKSSKKRKAEESSEDESSSEDEKAKKKRRKEEKKAAKKSKAETDSEEALTSEKKDKKRKSKSAKDDTSDDTQDETEKKSKKNKKKEEKQRKEAETDDEDSSDGKASKKKKRKGETEAEKTARKEEKKRRKEEKRAKKELSRDSTSTPSASTPTASGTSTPVLRGHHAVRSRWIAQKRMATMDDKALNAIFMVKSQS
ncbi:G-patch domain-containing protein [Colletotrichum higginsianum]|uniref:PinX1-related protein 1 n=2 Tax=Colletotrichum higginsianum TaxID=80884 RepID=H1VNU0_COLHI|nr:G-patch domain-containing protein [Colletotrichum higginsianum IMI 349063]OBR15226.1 G-patch domain-containing protein [Colletotrichum higginsianum IMI 349063]TID04743.1 Protein PXR1 [Colletotrichum higginsianum]GJC92508.1 G-patch domain-containing protein [Colletotrichum higginsianum]CCF41894.1 G-patch domain-containing protein [Colletotrichum higginsianum]